MTTDQIILVIGFVAGIFAGIPVGVWITRLVMGSDPAPGDGEELYADPR